MAVFERVRNWRVCTRSLYAIVPLSPFLLLSLSLFLPFCRPFAARRFPLCRPSSSTRHRASRSFFRRRDSCAPLVPASYVSSSHRVSLYRVAFSYCHSPPFTQPFILREYSSAIRKGDTATFRWNRSLSRLHWWSFDASRSDYARPSLIQPLFLCPTLVHTFVYFAKRLSNFVVNFLKELLDKKLFNNLY